MAVINKVYKFISPQRECGYIFSEQNQGDSMGFNYYVITIKDGVPDIAKIGNAIQTLQQKHYKLYPFTEGELDYENFLKIKEIAEKRKKAIYSADRSKLAKPNNQIPNNNTLRKRNRT